MCKPKKNDSRRQRLSLNLEMGDATNDVKGLDVTKALSLEPTKPLVKDNKKRTHTPTLFKCSCKGGHTRNHKISDSRDYKPSGMQ